MIDNLTKFTERFYESREPVGTMIKEIENLDTKTNDELDTLGKEYCNTIARLLPDFRGIYVDGYSTRINGESVARKYNGLICRFYSGKRNEWKGNFIPDTDIPFDNKAHEYSTDYLDINSGQKQDLIKKLHKIVAILKNQENNPKIFEELKIAMNIGQEFECSGGMQEKLSLTITAMESKLQSSIDGLFYTFKDNCINTVLGGMYNDGQSTHYIASARYMIREQYSITQNEKGWNPGIKLSDVQRELQAYFGMDATIHDAINYVTAEVINKLNSIKYDPLANVKISNEPFIKVLGNQEFEGRNLFVIDWSDGSHQKNLNFEAIARQQVIQHATNRLQFIKDQEMRILGMESVFDLIMTASGSKVQGKSYDQTEGWQKIPIEKDFSTLDEILESLELVSSTEHKDAIVQILRKVETEITSLNGVDHQLKDRQVYKINDCIAFLNSLTEQQYADLTRIEQLRQVQEQRRQVQEQRRQEQRRQVQEQVEEQIEEQRRQERAQRRQVEAQLRQVREQVEEQRRRQVQEQIEEQLRQIREETRQIGERNRQEQEQRRQVQEQEQAQVRQVQSLTLDVIIRMYNSTIPCSKDSFKEALWLQCNLLVGKDKKEQFNEKADVLYDSFSKINPTDSEDLQVTLWEEIKAFMLFIAKCVLTVGILPVIEAVEGKSYFISSDRELKTITQEKHRSFVDFVRRNREAAALQQQ